MATTIRRLKHFIILAASEEDDSVMSVWWWCAGWEKGLGSQKRRALSYLCRGHGVEACNTLRF